MPTHAELCEKRFQEIEDEYNRILQEKERRDRVRSLSCRNCKYSEPPAYSDGLECHHPLIRGFKKSCKCVSGLNPDPDAELLCGEDRKLSVHRKSWPTILKMLGMVIVSVAPIGLSWLFIYYNSPSPYTDKDDRIFLYSMGIFMSSIIGSLVGLYGHGNIYKRYHADMTIKEFLSNIW